jgi:hypothetical protein
MTYALRETCDLAAHALAAPIASVIALMTPAALGLSGDPVHEPVHALKLDPCGLLYDVTARTIRLLLRPAVYKKYGQCSICAGSTNGTNRTNSTRCAGIFQSAVARTVPCGRQAKVHYRNQA